MCHPELQSLQWIISFLEILRLFESLHTIWKKAGRVDFFLKRLSKEHARLLERQGYKDAFFMHKDYPYNKIYFAQLVVEPLDGV